MNCKHELIDPKILRSNSYVIERGTSGKCGAVGQYLTTATRKDGKYVETRKWEKVDG